MKKLKVKKTGEKEVEKVEKTGVATQIKALNSKCLYTHCYGHALSLAVADAIKSVKCISDSLETVREIAKLVKKSP